MAKPKAASKQAVEGTSRSQPASKNRTANTANPGKASSKPPPSLNKPPSSNPQNRRSSTTPAPKPPQPQLAANRSLNRTKFQSTSNGSPKPQGANGSACIFGEAGATSGHKASQDRPMQQAAHKRGNGPNNNPRKTPGHVPAPRPNVSLNPQAPKPKHHQPVTGGKPHSPAPNSQKAQNRVPTLQLTQTHQRPTNSGKNATNGSPKTQTQTQHPPGGGHPKSTMGDWFLGPTKPPLPTKNPTSPPAKASSPISSAGLKGTGNRISKSTNPSGSKRNSSIQTNMSAKQSPAVESLGLSGWLSSWLPTGGLAPVQATKKTTSKPNKAKGPPNGSHTKRIESSNSSTSARDAKSRLTNALKKDSPGNNKAHSESRHVQETFNKGNNSVSAKRSSGLAEGQSLGRSKTSAFPPKKDSSLASKQMTPTTSTETKDTGGNGKSASGCSPKSSGSKCQPATTGGVVTQKRQHIPLAQEVFTATPTQSPFQKSQAAAPNLSFGGLFNQVSSFFGWTGEVARGAAPMPLASVRQVSKSSKGDDNLSKSHSAPTLSSTSSAPKHSEFSSKFSVGSVTNGAHDVRDRLSKSNSSDHALKKQTPDLHEGRSKPIRSDVELRVASKRTTHRAQKSTKHRSVRSLVKVTKNTSLPRKKEFQVRSSSSRVLSRAPKTLRNGLLRQYSPTLIWRSSDSPKVVSAYSTLAASPLHGFWPWANTNDPTLPTTYDGSHQRKPIMNKDQANFIQQQRNEEVALGRWSKPFGKKLLPGMYSSPIGAVPKSTPGKYRLIVNQSVGPHALNSLIPKSQIKVKLDNIHDLGTALIAVRKKHPKRKLTLFKSDVKSAYRQLPMHPSWQIKQVISIDGQRYVDRCNTFGSRGGGWNWDAFASLVNWIGTEKKNIPGLLGYVDDNFGWEFEGNTKYYRPYKKHLPAKQTRLLKLWDELGIPHDEEKQLSGPCLPILGYEVDANAMTVKVPDEKKAKVVRLLRNCAHKGKSYTLKDMQSVAGSVNATLCLYPHLRSGLRGLFDEMAGKERPSTKLTVTTSVARSLSKLADYIECAKPVPIRQKN